VGNAFLSKVAHAHYTVPIDIFDSPLSSKDEAACRYGVLLMDAFTFLAELAPNGYQILQVVTELVDRGRSIKVNLRFMVSDADHARIQAEWHPLSPPTTPPFQGA